MTPEIDPARLLPPSALIDLFIADSTSALAVLAELSEIIPTENVNVLSLGPPLRLHVPAAALVHVMNQLNYERIMVLQWPFSHSARSNRNA